MASKNTDEWYRKRAFELYQNDGEVEVDYDVPAQCIVSTNDDPCGSDGAYVQAWVWVDDDEEEGYL